MALKMSDRELSLIMMRAPWGLFVVDISYLRTLDCQRIVMHNIQTNSSSLKQPCSVARPDNVIRGGPL